ncbi:hypothetical protein RFI_30110 [Reticulomyxa filosa]|uniref:Uncharacterized protein n=1 Tax=Reticulomyxa filosa TaxID=46433 RepID=X6M0Z7_RETFI|nr:hypothetical protein RFI_30110 [Reticulomyxa filosa]|eukprot:ETO07281.1 hypothetical protein RFI_30110 [Reticulomyxa filosa]
MTTSIVGLNDAASQVIEKLKQILADPRAFYDSLTPTQKKICLVLSGLTTATVVAVTYGKTVRYIRYMQGYMQCDTMSRIFLDMLEENMNTSIHMFEVSDDSFTRNDLIYLFENLCTQYINFRSRFVRLGSSWYAKEIPNAATDPNVLAQIMEHNLKFRKKRVLCVYNFVGIVCIRNFFFFFFFFVYIPNCTLKSSSSGSGSKPKKTEKEIEEEMLEGVMNWLNGDKDALGVEEKKEETEEERSGELNGLDRLNPGWLNYQWPNWKVYYFHFNDLQKCVCYVIINHAVIDGIGMCLLIEKLHSRLWGHHNDALSKQGPPSIAFNVNVNANGNINSNGNGNSNSNSNRNANANANGHQGSNSGSHSNSSPVHNDISTAAKFSRPSQIHDNKHINPFNQSLLNPHSELKRQDRTCLFHTSTIVLICIVIFF